MVNYLYNYFVMKAIKAFPIPKSRKEIKSFLGLLGYYRKFIRDFAKLTKPLTQKSKGKTPTKIEAEFTEAVELCKTLLCNTDHRLIRMEL